MTRPVRDYPIPTRRHPPKLRILPPPKTWQLVAGRIGAIVLCLTAIAVLIGPTLWSKTPHAVETGNALSPPSLAHPMGTDHFGRDVLARILYGGRLSIGGALAAVFLGSTIGTILGLTAGYKSGPLDIVFGSAMDALLALPGLVLALVLTWLLGQGMQAAIFSVGIARIPVYFRISRAAARKLRRAQFVRTAQAIGAGEGRIIARHILPNMAGLIATAVTSDIGWSLLYLSAISFLGVGVQPPQVEWGQMLSEARLYLRSAPWLAMAPGLAILLTVLSASLIAEAIQDSIDPIRAGLR